MASVDPGVLAEWQERVAVMQAAARDRIAASERMRMAPEHLGRRRPVWNAAEALPEVKRA